MEATLTELRRKMGKVTRAADRGEEVLVTNNGRPRYRLTAFIPTVVYDNAETMRAGTVTDADILAAVRESREDLADRA